ncbi:MAG: toll/interleukin-1 receptor domain-containing protein [Acidobacteriota bacterium]
MATGPASETARQGCDPAGCRYGVFISYSHRADRRLSWILKSSLQRFAKPFYRMRARAVYLDQTNLETTPELWPEIQKSLLSSHYFLLLASPAAAESTWVAREIQCWLANRPAARLFIGWTAGDLAWSHEAGDFDWQQTTAIPRALSGCFHEEPFWLDLRWAVAVEALAATSPQLRQTIAPLVARVDGVDLETLVGEDTRQHRLFRRAATAVGAVLTCLTVVAIALAFFFLQQRNLARDNATKAENNRQEAVRRLVRLNTANGIQLLDGGDWSGALVWLTEALKLGDENGVFQRIRLASLFGDYPRPHAAIFPGCTVLHAEYSADGRRIATACDDSTARVWDAETGEPVTAPLQHQGPVNWASFSMDGRHVVTVSLGRSMNLKDPVFHGASATSDTGDLRAKEREQVEADFGYFQIWDAASGRAVSPPVKDTLPYALLKAVFLPDGARLMVWGHAARVWKMSASGTPTPTDVVAEADADLSIAPDGSVFAAASYGGSVDIVDTASGARRFSLRDSLAVQFSHDSRLLAAGDVYGNVQILNALDGKAVTGDLKNHGVVTVLAFTRDDRVLIVGTVTQKATGELNFWNTKTGNAHLDVHELPFSIAGGAISPDGMRFFTVSAGEPGSVRKATQIWEAPDRAGMINIKLRQLAPVMSGIEAMQWHRDSRRLLSIGPGAIVRTWDLDPNPEYQPAPPGRGVFAPRYEVRRVKESAQVYGSDDRPVGPSVPVSAHRFVGAVSPDGNTLALGIGDDDDVERWGTLGLWDLRTGRAIANGLKHDFYPRSLEFSQDGQRLLTMFSKGLFDDGWARVWDVASGRPLTPNLAHGNAIKAAHFDSAGRRVVTASPDGAICIWDAFTGKQLNPQIRHPGRALQARFSPSGDAMLSLGGEDGNETLVLWNAASGETLAPTMRHPLATEVSFSPDGRIVASAGHDTVRLWIAATGEPLTGAIESASATWAPTGTQLYLAPLARDYNTPWHVGHNTPRLWTATPAPDTADHLSARAQFLAARHVDKTGGIVPLGAAALRELWDELRRPAAGK